MNLPGWGLTPTLLEQIRNGMLTMDQKLRIMAIAVPMARDRTMTIETAIQNVLQYLKDETVWKDPE